MSNKKFPLNPAGYHDIGAGMTDEAHQTVVPNFQDVMRVENGAFVDYVFDFYGKNDSIYGAECFPPKGVSKLEVLLAVKIRQLTAIEESPFDEGSIDRELVRDIIVSAKAALEKQQKNKIEDSKGE